MKIRICQWLIELKTFKIKMIKMIKIYFIFWMKMIGFIDFN